MSGLVWDEATIAWGWNKSVDTTFLAGMKGELCSSQSFDGWDRQQMCVRNEGHSGRHMATDWRYRYPVAVWA